jgi:dual specificity phosphatase 12
MACCEIIPNLWLGNIKIAQNNNFFEKYNIDCVINCSTDIPFYSNYTDNIRISINDNLKSSEIDKMYSYLDKASDIINKYLLLNKKILVHCYAGKQRSACVIAAFLIKYAGMTLKNSIIAIKSKRLISFTPDINFLESLKRFNNDLLSN